MDFSVRDPERRFYLARLSAFERPPRLGDEFTGTDHEEFEVECVVEAIDHVGGRVYVRPVRAEDVPGTTPVPEPRPAAPRIIMEGVTIRKSAGTPMRVDRVKTLTSH